MNPNVNQLCLGVIGSTAHATRAQHVLSRAAIRSEVVKISSEQKSGCMYGIRISCEQRRIAEEVLTKEFRSDNGPLPLKTRGKARDPRADLFR